MPGPRCGRRGRAAAAAALWLMAALLPAGHPTLKAQGEAPGGFLEATMLTAAVRFETEPWVRTRLSLLDGDTTLGEVTAMADGDGIVQAEFPATEGLEPVIRPGRLLAAVPDAGEAVTVTVPELSVILDEPGRRLVGTGPPGGDLVGMIRNGAGDEEAVATAVDAAGRYTIGLPAAMRNTPNLSGLVTLAAPTWALHAAFRELQAELEVGGAVVSGTATLGREIRVAARGAGGANGVTAPTEVLRRPFFTATVTSQAAPRPVLPGDLVLVYEDGNQRLGGIAPDITIEATAAGKVSGTSLAGTRVRIQTAGPTGAHAVETMADETGRFHADLSDLALLLPGSWVKAGAGSRLAFQATSLVTGVEVPVYRPYVRGIVAPSAAIRLAIQDADGAFRASAETTAGADGQFRADLRDRDDEATRLRPGDTMILAVGNAPFQRYELPDMGAIGEPEEDFVAGHGPPGRSMLVSVSAPDGAVVTAAPDELGLLVADFGPAGGRYDIVPGSMGSLTVREPGHVVVLTPWAAPRLSVTLLASIVGGTGLPGQGVTTDLAAGPIVLAEGSGAAADDDGTFGFELTAPAAGGQGLPVAAGDQLRLALPGWTHFTTLPDLAITANPVGNVVGGTASPGDEIALSLRRGSRRADWRTVTAESGRYTVTLAPRWSLTPGDVVVAADQVDSVTDVRVAARVADLELDMSGGGVSGFARPGDRVTARLVRAGSPIAAAVGQAEEDGTYELDLQDQGLLPVAARGGDDLIIATGGQTLTVPVPQFTARLDSSSDTVTGTAPDSLAPRITLRQAAGPLAGRWIDVTTATEAGDTYVAHAPGRGVQAGTEAAVSLDWRSHRFLRRLRAPFLDAQRGGGIVAGLADPRATLDLSVTRGGTVVTTTTLGAGADGSFVADLSQGPGAIRLAPGDAIGLRAPGVAATAAVAPVTASLRAPDRLLAGQAPADSNVFIRVADGPEADLAAGLVATADSAGTFSATLPGDGPLGAGSSAEAAVLDADGHRTHVLDVVPYIRARIGASVLTGRAPPLASLALTVRTGEREARRLLRADSRGNWGGEALVDGAAAAIIRPLDTITLSVSGGRDVTVMVPVLSAGFAPKGALAGLAPAGKDVMVELEDAGGRMVRLATRALRDGAWSVGESDLPPGAAFPLRQAVTAVAWVLVGNGHRMEARAHRGQATPTPFITSTPPASATAPATVTSTATASPTATISGTAVTPPTPGPQLWPVYLPRAATKRR